MVGDRSETLLPFGLRPSKAFTGALRRPRDKMRGFLASWPGRRLLHEFERIHTEPLSDALHAAESEVPLTPLDSTEVGTVHTDCLGEPLLREPPSFTKATQVRSDSPL